MTVSHVEFPRYQLPNTISDSKPLNYLVLEHIRSSKSESVFICDLSTLTSQIRFDAWWDSKKVGFKPPIPCNDSRHAFSRLFYLHCGTEGTGNPGKIWIVCHQLLCHPLAHGTSSVGKPLLAIEHITKLDELTESQVTELGSLTVEETALAIQMRQEGQGIWIVHSQWIFIVDILIALILSALIDKTLHSGRAGLWNCRMPPRHLELWPHVRNHSGLYSIGSYLKTTTLIVI